MVTLGIVFLFSVIGLVVDVGYGYFVKQVAQAAADSAAMAGALYAKDQGGTCSSAGVQCQTSVCAVSPSSPPQNNFDAACLYASANGFATTASQSVTMSANSGSPSNAGVSANYWVTATATKTTPLSFLSMIGVNVATVSASATAAIIGNTGGGCIYALDPKSPGAYTQVGNTTVQSSCGIFDNSSASGAFIVKGGGTVNASGINVVGSTTLNNNTTVSPAPSTGVSPITDPFASLPAPTYSGCDHTNTSYSSGAVVTLSPGVYCNGIKASGNAQLTFSPGTYILNGGGMQISSSFITLTGTGVTFYNTANGYSFAPITIVGNATINLSAPTSGTYEGILMFQDRSITASAASAIGGGSTETLAGTVYMPTATLDFAGGSTTSSLTVALVVADVNIVGNSYISRDLTGQVTGLSQPSVSLVQ